MATRTRPRGPVGTAVADRTTPAMVMARPLARCLGMQRLPKRLHLPPRPDSRPRTWPRRSLTRLAYQRSQRLRLRRLLALLGVLQLLRRLSSLDSLAQASLLFHRDKLLLLARRRYTRHLLLRRYPLLAVAPGRHDGARPVPLEPLPKQPQACRSPATRARQRLATSWKPPGSQEHARGCSRGSGLAASRLRSSFGYGALAFYRKLPLRR